MPIIVNNNSKPGICGVGKLVGLREGECVGVRSTYYNGLSSQTSGLNSLGYSFASA